MARAHLLRGGLALAVVGALAAPAMAQGQTQPLTVKKISSNVYVAFGGGGNSGIIIGKDGVIIVDTKTSKDYGEELLAEVAKLTPKKVTDVFLTHSDGDHVNGLAAFPAGLTIVAQENCKKEMEAAIAAGGRGAPPADRLPNRVVTRPVETMTLQGITFQVHHWAPAHTSGDLVVYLPSEKIVFTGDIIAAQLQDPIIHVEKHGSSEGWITTMKGILGLGATQFIPGHGDPQTRTEVQARLDRVAAKRAAIIKLINEGKTLAEIEKAEGDAVPAGGQRPRFPSLSEVVYQEVTGKKM
ncbi:MAG TPA: MBL fold metallo-hydrolase [Vicinamibacterales bacterium]|nr:MBL fold metallo-hydrolase [Vicinamibacterales bacterium]